MVEQLGSILKYFWTKLILTIPVGYFILGEDHFLVLWALFMIILLDTGLGMWVSYKYKIFTSHRLARVTTKIARYAIGLASIWVLACLAPELFGWAFKFFGIFFVLTEVFSNFEKLSLLGLRLPTRLLAKLNRNFYHFYFGEPEKKREAVSKILSKGRNQNDIYPDDIDLDENIFNK